MIVIRNLRNLKDIKGILVKVDRSSVLGNPYPMYSEEQRDTVCEKYEIYFQNQVSTKKNNAFMNELRRIWKLAKNGDVTLACWCYPKRCHAETIKKFIESYL